MDRTEYRSNEGVAAWWAKDGAWHIALPEQGRNGFFWTAEQFTSKEAAIKAIREQNDDKEPFRNGPDTNF